MFSEDFDTYMKLLKLRIGHLRNGVALDKAFKAWATHHHPDKNTKDEDAQKKFGFISTMNKHMQRWSQNLNIT